MTIRPGARALPRPACCSSGRPPSSRAAARGAAALLFVASALAGCASTPQATVARDAEAKQFIARPDSATLYIYRPDRSPGGEDSVLYVDGRLIGSTLPATYFRIELRPGTHLLRGYGHDNGSLKVEARPGEAAFVALAVMDGDSRFSRVGAETGKRDIVRCCALMENWTPGQRPLLR
jgi:hypothetical protein